MALSSKTEFDDLTARLDQNWPGLFYFGPYCRMKLNMWYAILYWILLAIGNSAEIDVLEWYDLVSSFLLGYVPRCFAFLYMLLLWKDEALLIYSDGHYIIHEYFACFLLLEYDKCYIIMPLRKMAQCLVHSSYVNCQTQVYGISQLKIMSTPFISTSSIITACLFFSECYEVCFVVIKI